MNPSKLIAYASNRPACGAFLLMKIHIAIAVVLITKEQRANTI